MSPLEPPAQPPRVRIDGHECRVVLVGMMGSGKTTVGRRLAEVTGWPLHDNDDLLRELYGLTPREILQKRGEDALRAAEDAALAAGLDKAAPSVVDAAGGTILSARSRERLRDVLVVWLKASPETLYARALGTPHRAWLDRGEEWMRAAVLVRYPLYESVADLTLDTDTAEPLEVARDIVTWLRDVSICAPYLPSDS